MALSSDERSTLRDISSEAPPEGFDADYARLALAVRESARSKPWIDKAAIIVALLTSVIAALTSLTSSLNAGADKAAKDAEQAYNNQVSMTRIYFEKLAGADPKATCLDAALFAKASLSMAGISAEQASAITLGRTPQDVTKTDPIGVQRLALIIFEDVERRKRQHLCDYAVAVSPSADTRQLVDAQPSGNADTSSYGSTPRLPAAGAQKFSVWVQAPSDSPETIARAKAMEAKLARGGVFRVPAVEPVEHVPDQDQIRIYHRADAERARALSHLLGLRSAEIVNLASAYPSLPEGVMEVWLARPGATRNGPTSVP